MISMNIIKKAGIALLGIMLFVGCGSKELKTQVYEMNNNDIYMNVTLYYQDDVVKKQVSKTEIPYSSSLYGGASKEEIKEAVDNALKNSEGLEGLTDTVDYLEDKLVETIELDYEKIDFDKAVKVFPNLFPDYNENADAKIKFVSFKKTDENMIKEGFTKK